MQKIKSYVPVLLFLCCGLPAVGQPTRSAPGILVELEQYEIRLIDDLVVPTIPDGFLHSATGQPALPWLQVLVDGHDFSTTGELVILEADTIALAAPLAVNTRPVQTRAENTWGDFSFAEDVLQPDRDYPRFDSLLISPAFWQDQPILSVTWCPFRLNQQDNLLIVIRRAMISGEREAQGTHPILNSGALRTVYPYSDAGSYYRDYLKSTTLSRIVAQETQNVIQTGLPTAVDYLIVTNNLLAPALRPLAFWRLQQGFKVGIATVADIVASYPGEDDPARIRAYLAEAYEGGLQYCLLGGDETIVPIRYAYHAYSDTMPDYDKMQICDLYYAEYDGDWDTDLDGIYGEYLQDNAEVYPEVYLGRLLAADALQAEQLVNKILTYEQNPGNGDFDYLTRALFTCADQMRDWYGNMGQHEIIGANFPEEFQLDLDSQSENPSGYLPDPQAPLGPDFVDYAGLGWGWTTVINHGRADGFILRAAGANQHPKAYIWTNGNNGDGHGHLNLLADDTPPGILLSVSCSLGGFDMDGPLFAGMFGANISEMLLQKPTGGVVAAIAYSRWGWVASSYRILAKVAEYAFDPTITPRLGVAFTLAKTSFPYYRDQNYGLNLYGDPALLQWTTAPQVMTVNHPSQVGVGSGAVEFMVTDQGNPVSTAVITAAYGDTIFFVGQTDQTGRLTWLSGPDRVGGYDITIIKPGYLPVSSQLISSIAAGIFSEEEGTPQTFALHQNHPNPFNPSTTIEFSLPEPRHVRLEVFDILGRQVTVALDEVRPSGYHRLIFDGRDKHGLPLASGIYFYRLTAGDQSEDKKMVLLR